MGAAAKLGLLLAMVVLVVGAQLLEREIAAGRGARKEAAKAAAAAPPVALLLAPLDEARLPAVPPGPPGGGPATGFPAGPTPGLGRGERLYQIQPGDTLAKIAKKTLGREAAWQLILERNRAAIPDPTRLQVGASLRIPAAGATSGPPRQLTTGARLR
jgi:nucleoid-associated protein YgaU